MDYYVNIMLEFFPTLFIFLYLDKIFVARRDCAGIIQGIGPTN